MSFCPKILLYNRAFFGDERARRRRRRVGENAAHRRRRVRKPGTADEAQNQRLKVTNYSRFRNDDDDVRGRPLPSRLVHIVYDAHKSTHVLYFVTRVYCKIMINACICIVRCDS